MVVGFEIRQGAARDTNTVMKELKKKPSSSSGSGTVAATESREVQVDICLVGCKQRHRTRSELDQMWSYVVKEALAGYGRRSTIAVVKS